MTFLNNIPSYTAAKVNFEGSVEYGYDYGGYLVNYQMIGGQIGFCIEPEILVTITEGYKEVEHAPNLSLTAENKMIQAAHVEFNKENNSAADFVATQVYIWKIVYEDLHKSSSYNLNMNTNIPNFSAKIKAIEDGIKKLEYYANTSVSFDDTLKKIKQGESETLTDKNGLLSERGFKVVSKPKGVTVSISGNKLTIKASSAESGTIRI